MGQACVEVPGGEAKDTRVGWRSRGPSLHRGGGGAGEGGLQRGMEEGGHAVGRICKQRGGGGGVARAVDEREAKTLLQEYVKKFERLTGGDAVVGGGGGGVVCALTVGVEGPLRGAVLPRPLGAPASEESVGIGGEREKEGVRGRVVEEGALRRAEPGPGGVGRGLPVSEETRVSSGGHVAKAVRVEGAVCGAVPRSRTGGPRTPEVPDPAVFGGLPRVGGGLSVSEASVCSGGEITKEGVRGRVAAGVAKSGGGARRVTGADAKPSGGGLESDTSLSEGSSMMRGNPLERVLQQIRDALDASAVAANASWRVCPRGESGEGVGVDGRGGGGGKGWASFPEAGAGDWYVNLQQGQHGTMSKKEKNVLATQGTTRQARDRDVDVGVGGEGGELAGERGGGRGGAQREGCDGNAVGEVCLFASVCVRERERGRERDSVRVQRCGFRVQG